VPDTRVLLLGNASSDVLARALTRAGRVLTRTTTPDEAVRLGPSNDVIVIDAVPAPGTIAEVCRDIRAVPELAEIPVLAVAPGDSVEERIRLLEAGADDVIARPIDDRELDARVEALDLRYRRSKELHPGLVVTPTRRPGHRLIVVFSPKGGVGTTTIAVNLALVLAARQPDQVALLDLAGGIGQVWTHLDLNPRATLSDLLRDASADADPTAFAGYLTRHASGLRVLVAPTSPLSSLSPDQAIRIVETALTAVPTVVVDAGSRLEPGTEAILGLADDLLFVVTPEFAALKAVRGAFEHLSDSGVGIGEPRIVLNEQFAHEMLTPSDIENALGRAATVRMPYDALLYQRATNEGRPIYSTAPHSAPGQRLELLARVILGEDVPHEAETNGRRRRRGLFSRA
jgi:pilus assembly protein CpaE